jgi:hypothetical protein
MWCAMVNNSARTGKRNDMRMSAGAGEKSGTIQLSVCGASLAWFVSAAVLVRILSRLLRLPLSAVASFWHGHRRRGAIVAPWWRCSGIFGGRCLSIRRRCYGLGRRRRELRIEL